MSSNEPPKITFPVVNCGKPFTELIKDYYDQRPDFADLSKQIEQEERKLNQGTADAKSMPVHPKEEEAGKHITDQVAKESSNSNASDHHHYSIDEGKSHAGKDGPLAHLSEYHSKGPVIAENMPEKASKEELKKRAEELNK